MFVFICGVSKNIYIFADKGLLKVSFPTRSLHPLPSDFFFAY